MVLLWWETWQHFVQMVGSLLVLDLLVLDITQLQDDMSGERRPQNTLQDTTCLSGVELVHPLR